MRRIVAHIFVTLVLASPAVAQNARPIELGLDGVLAVDLDSPHGTSLSIPVQRIRAGFFISPTISIEPSGSLEYSKVDDNSATFLGLGVGALYHLRTVRTAAQPYVRPFVGLGHARFDTPLGDDSQTRWSLGAGIGVKLPIANRFAWRLEGAYSHGFESGTIQSSNSLQAIFGLSYFTR